MSQQTFHSDENSYAAGQASFVKPLQLSQALWQLPRQFIKVMFKPSLHAFRAELGKAGWGMVFIQLYLLIVLTVALTYLGHIIPGSALHTTGTVSIGPYRPFTFLPSPYNGIAFILGSFFVGLITAFVFSRLMGGRGRFVTHTYGLLLCTIPLVTISGALLLIPASGSAVALLVLLIGLLFVYRLLLHVRVIVATHGLSAGKATVIVLVIPLIFVILGVVGILIVTGGELLAGLADVLGLDWIPFGGGGQPDENRPRRQRRRARMRKR